MDEASSGLGLAAIERYADAWKELHARIGCRFVRAEARERELAAARRQVLAPDELLAQMMDRLGVLRAGPRVLL